MAESNTHSPSHSLDGSGALRRLDWGLCPRSDKHTGKTPIACVHPDSHLGRAHPKRIQVAGRTDSPGHGRKAGSWLGGPTIRQAASQSEESPACQSAGSLSKGRYSSTLSHSTDRKRSTCPSCTHEGESFVWPEWLPWGVSTSEGLKDLQVESKRNGIFEKLWLSKFLTFL